MRRRKVYLFAVGILAVGWFYGCDRSPLSRFDTPDEMTLYSVDFREVQAMKKDIRSPTGEFFRDHPVLGKVQIEDPELRRALISNLQQAYRRRPWPMNGAGCYWPRHGLRVVQGEETVDYLICLQCGGFEEFVGEELLRYSSMGGCSAELFNRPLIEVGIRIVPESGSDWAEFDAAK